MTLPDDSTYYWWLQSQSGSVSLPPKSITGKENFVFHPEQSGTLVVLDKHTGQIAVEPFSISASTLSLTISDFHALERPAPPQAPQVATPKPVVQQQGSSPIGNFITFLIGCAVIAGVIWAVRSLLQSRGKLITEIARKAGLDVPDLDSGRVANASVEGKYEPPAQRAVERIPESALASAALPTASAWLVGTTGSISGLSFPLAQGGVVIGRDERSTIRLTDASVSRRHAKIEARGQGNYVVRDEGSSNGVFVNGEQIIEHILRSGDTIRIGEASFRFDQT